MQNLHYLIENNEEWLIERIISYGKLQNYLNDISTLKGAWRSAVKETSSSILCALTYYDLKSHTPINEDFNKECWRFGRSEAELHQQRGLNLIMFLGILKNFKRSYCDLIKEAGFKREVEWNYCLLIEDYFDQAELGYCKAWSESNTEENIKKLQAANTEITNEKNKFLTIFESIPDPVFLFNEENKIEFLNHAATKLIPGPEVPARYYYTRVKEQWEAPWLEEELQSFQISEEEQRTFEKQLDINGIRRYFKVQFSRINDISVNFTGVIAVFDERTQWKLTEKALRESEERYRSLFIDNQTVILIINPRNGKIIDANPAALSFYGYKEEEILEKNISDITTLNSKKIYQEMDKAVIKQGRHFNFQHRLADGEIREVEVFCGPLTLNGEYFLYSMVHDITEQKIAMAQTRKLTQAIVQSPSSVVITDIYGSIEYVNPKFTKATGYEPEEVIGSNPRILKSGELPPEEYTKLWDAITKGNEWRGEFHNKKKNGELFWEFASISPVKDENGIVTHFVGVKEDITERKENERQLQLWAKVFATKRAGIIIANAEGMIQAVNHEFMRATGYEEHELKGSGIDLLSRILYDKKSFKELLVHLRKQEDWGDEAWICCKNGEIYPVWLNINMVLDSKGTVTNFVATFNDITANVELRREIVSAGALQKSSLRGDLNNDYFYTRNIFKPYQFVSGDYYDYRLYKKKRLLNGFLLDVMGHGLATALQISALRVLFRQATEINTTVKEQLAWINRESTAFFKEGHFGAAIYFRFDFVNGLLTLASAGISYVIYISGNQAEVITLPGLFLGINADEEYDEIVIKVNPGDSIVFLTDGLYDLLTEDLIMSITSLESAFEILDKLTENVTDDATALGIYVKSLIPSDC